VNPRLFHLDIDFEHIASAVCEAYTPEGVDTWWRNWIHADEDKRQQMERGITDPTMWSGERPDMPGGTA
jgi:hypothetical protein